MLLTSLRAAGLAFGVLAAGLFPFAFVVGTVFASGGVLDQSALCAGGTIDLPAGTYQLPATLVVVHPVVIRGAGAGATILKAAPRSRLFLAEADLVVSDVTLQGGVGDTYGGAIAANTDTQAQLTVERSAVVGDSAADGGGLAMAAMGAHFANPCAAAGATTAQPVNTGGPSSLHVDDVAFADDSGANSGAGGAVYVAGGSAYVSDSSFDHDSAGKGGALFSQAGALQMWNDTLVDDSSGGGGAFAAWAGGTLLQNVTFDRNSAAAGADVAVFNSAVVRSVNSILASPGACSGVLVSLGHNLDSGRTCSLRASHDQSAIGPRLGSPALNGASTITEAVLAGSPALKDGDPANCPAVDQRGVARPAHAACDLGAFESALAPAPSPTPAPSGQPAPSPTPRGAVEAASIGLPSTGAPGNLIGEGPNPQRAVFIACLALLVGLVLSGVTIRFVALSRRV